MLVRPLLAPAERLVDALCDPAQRQRAMIGLAVVYALAWTLYAVIAKSSQDVNADMAEMVVWARELALGYPKHPPLPAWMLAGWFAVFPLADWAYYLLAGATVAAGLYVAFVLAGEWLDGAKRAAVPFLLAVIPFYNFMGLKFDQNSAPIPFWGLAIWAHRRTLDTRRPGWAVLAGLAAAAAMLIKYWAVFLVLSLLLAALFDRRRVAYFRSAAPWISALVFGLAVLPHAIWLVRENFPPLHWVGARRSATSLVDWLSSLGEYTFGTIGYCGIALLMVLVLAWPSLAAIRDGWLPRDADRRTVAILFWSPLLLPILAAAVSGTSLLSLWNEPALSLLPVMMLSSPLIMLTREAVVRMAVFAAAVTVVALLASPVVAIITLNRGTENYAAYGRLVATSIEDEWKGAVTKPLRLVGGPFTLASTAAFYSHDRPSTYADFSRYLSPWVDDARIAREGIAMVCPASDAGCLAALSGIAAAGPSGRRTEVTLVRRWFGFEGTPERFVIAVVPPRS